MKNFNILFNYLKNDFLKEIFHFLNKGSSRVFLILSVLILLLRKSLVPTYNDFVIDKVLKYIVKSVITDWIIIISVFVIVVMYSIHFFKKPLIRQNLLIFLYAGLIFGIYTYFRGNPNYNHYRFDWIWLNRFYYLDIIYIFSILIFIALITSTIIKFQKPIFYEDGFDVDIPLQDPKKDLFGRRPFAEKIAQKIMHDYNHKSSLAIGINGTWGSGKTSFVNMIKAALKREPNNKARIFIDFYPWKSTTTQQIVTDFFNEFTNEINKYSPNLSSKLKSYTKTLTEIDENLITKSIGTVADLVRDSETKEDLYKQINNNLEAMNKQIIVFIDDIDRLDKGEVVEVIKLVRNTASFHHVVFVVTYDREYVVNAIKNLNDVHPQFYLEKIFQYEFILPAYKKSILKDIFKDLIANKVSPEHKKQLDAFLYPSALGSANSSKDFFELFLITKRDVIRFVNTFLFDYSLINEEIDIVQLGIIDLLKVKHPDIYDILFDMKERFFNTNNRINTLNYPITLKRVGDDDREVANKGGSNLKPLVLEEYLKNCHPLKFNLCDTNLIIQLLEALFPSDPIKNTSVLSPYSIANDKNFYKYFSNHVFLGDISIAEFNNKRKLPIEKYKKQIDIWIEEKKTNEVLNRLRDIKLYNLESREDFEKHIKIIFYFGEKIITPSSPFPYDSQQLYNLLCHTLQNDRGLIKTWYNNSEDEYFKFVKNIFETADFPYNFASLFISILNYQYIDNFVLTKTELEKINLNYFKEYFNTTKKLDDTFWALYNNNSLTEKHNESGDGNTFQLKSSPNKVLNIILLDGIKKYNLFAEFFGFLITKQLHRDNYASVATETIKTIFNTSDVLEEYLEDMVRETKSKAIEEYRDFYNKAKKENFAVIQYPFKELKFSSKT